MSKEYKSCQSCSVPFEHDPKPEQKEHEMYCGACFTNGSFTNPEMTLNEMEDYVYKMAKEHTKFPDFMIKMHVKSIKKLERWKK